MAYIPRNDYSGLYRALVIDANDPEFKGRVKVRIPDLMVSDSQHVGEWTKNGLWAYPLNNMMGGRNLRDTTTRFPDGKDAQFQGQCLPFPKGSHVFVMFEKNDVSHPFVVGAAEYGDSTVLPENQLGREPYKKWTLFKSNAGRTIIVSDDKDDARFEITGKKRKIDNAPWGDLESVYQIDDNQTVFLIDERANHEKVLLKDYRGNFIKVIQDEQGVNDQLHVYMQNDIHMETLKDFYLTVAGNLHINVGQNIYVTALDNMYVYAVTKLQEYAHSIDRVSETYDNTKCNEINIKTVGNINVKSGGTIFRTSVNDLRSAAQITDCASGNITLNAGGALGINAASNVAIMGAKTLIQTSAITGEAKGEVAEAIISLMSEVAKPDGERYQDIITLENAPKFIADKSPDSLKAHEFKAPEIDLTQCPESGVGSSDYLPPVKVVAPEVPEQKIVPPPKIVENETVAVEEKIDPVVLVTKALEEACVEVRDLNLAYNIATGELTNTVTEGAQAAYAQMAIIQAVEASAADCVEVIETNANEAADKVESKVSEAAEQSEAEIEVEAQEVEQEKEKFCIDKMDSEVEALK